LHFRKLILAGIDTNMEKCQGGLEIDKKLLSMSPERVCHRSLITRITRRGKTESLGSDVVDLLDEKDEKQVRSQR
jgi:hypothetical protein